MFVDWASHEDFSLMKLDRVVFYGRLGEQAMQMFGLAAELDRWRGSTVLDCPGGPGTLAAHLRAEGCDVTAIDPVYALPRADLERRAAAADIVRADRSRDAQTSRRRGARASGGERGA